MNEESQVRGCCNITFICTPTRKQCVSVLGRFTETRRALSAFCASLLLAIDSVMSSALCPLAVGVSSSSTLQKLWSLGVACIPLCNKFIEQIERIEVACDIKVGYGLFCFYLRNYNRRSCSKHLAVTTPSTTAVDSSAQATGGLGITFIVIVLCLVVLPDVAAILRALFLRGRCAGKGGGTNEGLEGRG